MRLLRSALLGSVFVLAAPLASAQLVPSFGVTGGLNFGSLSDAATADLDQSTGYHIGIYGDFSAPLLPVALRASVLYVRVGEFGFEADTPGFEVDAGDADVSYVSVPLDFQFRYPLPIVKPYALVGPELRFPTGDLADFDGSRSVNVAVNAGIGAKLGALIGPEVFAELRYAFDVTGFFDEDELPFVGTVDEGGTFDVNVFYLRVGVGL